MKTIFGVLALCGMTFALSGNAVGETIIGKWETVKSFCEGGEVLHDWAKINKFRWRTFDKVSTTLIEDFSHMNEELKTKNCALHTKTNYSIIGDQYWIGPFLEFSSPNCPKLANTIRYYIKYTIAFLKDKVGTIGQNFIDRITDWQLIKEEHSPPVQFKISDNNHQLMTFASIEESKDICPGSRFGREYKRLE